MSKVVITGDRMTCGVGTRFLIAIGPAETCEIEVYKIVRETGAMLAKDAQGNLYRGYETGWSRKYLDGIPGGFARGMLDAYRERRWHRDQGFEIVGFHGTDEPASAADRTDSEGK